MPTRYSREELRILAAHVNDVLTIKGLAADNVRQTVLTRVAMFAQQTGMSPDQALQYIRNLANAA